MARNKRYDFDYYSYDVYALQDRKIKKVLRKHGPVASAVFTELLAVVYRENGYYVEYSRDIAEDISDSIYAKDADTVHRVIEDLIEAGIFDSALFHEKGVLTSAAIQRRFRKMSRAAGRKKSAFAPELNLLGSDEENGDDPESRDETTPESRGNPEGNPGSRGGNGHSPGGNADNSGGNGDSPPQSPPNPGPNLPQSFFKEKESKGKYLSSTPKARACTRGECEPPLTDRDYSDAGTVIRAWNEVFGGTGQEFESGTPPPEQLVRQIRRLRVSDREPGVLRKAFLNARDDTGFRWSLWIATKNQANFDQLKAGAGRIRQAVPATGPRGAPALTEADYLAHPF